MTTCMFCRKSSSPAAEAAADEAAEEALAILRGEVTE
jgi:hypothetical protein